MKCCICGSENWHRLEGAHSESLIVVCKECGLLGHYVDQERRGKMLAYYKTQYRQLPDHHELLTKHNKLRYVQRWLGEYLQGKKNLLCGDVGAATGYVLSFLKQLGHRVRGSEWDLLRRRFSEHYYGIPLEEQLNTKEPYDLLLIIHTLEHMIEPDKRLTEYVSALKDDGRLLISCPYWLETLEEQSGQPIQTFDNLFHKDHINLFTREALKNLFRKAGLAIEREDVQTYGQTYLLKKGKPSDIVKEDWQQVADKLLKQKDAMRLFHERKFKKAVDVWPAFPEAHLQLILGTYGKDPGRQEDMFSALPEPCKQNHRIRAAIAQWLTQMGKLDDAKKAWEMTFQTRPHPQFLMECGRVLVRLGRPKEALPLFAAVCQWDPRQWPECQNWMAKAACSIGAWDEQAKEQIKEAMLKQALETGAAKIELTEAPATGAQA